MTKIEQIVESHWPEEGNRGARVEALGSMMAIVWPRYDLERVNYYQDINLTQDEVSSLQVASDLSMCYLLKENNGRYSVLIDDAMAEILDSLDEDDETEEVRELAIDIETYSGVSLPDCGVYRYVEDPDFEILLFAYSVNGGKVRIVDFAQGEVLPERIFHALFDCRVLKTAYNAAFERICLSEWAHRKWPLYWPRKVRGYFSAQSWDCTMVRAGRLGLPMSLEACGKVLGIADQKMKEGKALIRYFSLPCKPTKANGGRTRNLPQHAPDKWATFKRYCKRDVEAEQEIRKRVVKKPVTVKERQLWVADQYINDRGVLIDLDMAQKACDMDAEAKDILFKRAQEITGLQNPNSVSQLKEFIQKREGRKMDALRKEDLKDIIKNCKDPDVRELLQIRLELGKTSNNKYKTMLECACSDGRVRGITQFYGAPRTGRWAGRLLQTQNLPQNHIPDLDTARRCVKAGDYEDMEMMYGNVTQTLSELIRTALIAKEGHTFHVCDFSAIECRVLAWMAGEEWVLDTFRKGGDIYCATASQMFHVPVEKHGQNAELRQKGKIATLACGYGGGVGALSKMGGERMGLTKDEMEQIIKQWREANPNIVKFWKMIEKACKYVVENETECEIKSKHLKFAYRWGGLAITLPSGRFIYYPRMHVGDPQQNEPLIYEGMNQVTKKWGEIPTYGGKLTENLIQSIARDCLAEVMLKCRMRCIPIVFHVHDEIICECDESHTLEEIEKIFSEEPEWAKGLPLSGAGYTTKYYMKD